MTNEIITMLIFTKRLTYSTKNNISSKK